MTGVKCFCEISLILTLFLNMTSKSGSAEKYPSKSALHGIRNKMPTIGSNSKSDYVILGSHSSWINDEGILPVELELHDGQKKVQKETHNWMGRELDVASLSPENDGEFELTAVLYLSNGSKEDVLINVITVC